MPPISRGNKPKLLRFWSFCGLLLALGPIAAHAQTGTYRLHQGPDSAGELVLRADGTFGYSFVAGSLDEEAKGNWKVEGKALHLVTIPKPVPPVFSAGAVAVSTDVPLSLHVTGPKGNGLAGVDLRVGFDVGEAVEDYTQVYGWTLADTEKRKPRWVEFSVPGYALRSQRFRIDVEQGNVLTFIITPNDIGVIDFTGVPAEFEPGRVTVHRREGDMVFEAATGN